MSEHVALDDSLRAPAGPQSPSDRQPSAQKTLRRFLPHSWKDLLAISIAIVSLAISLNTSQSQATRDQRQQLTDTLDRYLEIQVQQFNIAQEYQNAPDNLQLREFYRLISGAFGMQNTALLSQAAELAQNIPDAVEWVDYNTLAIGFLATGDIVSAERYYLAAIEAANTDYAKAQTQSTYAYFLFTQPARLEDGRDQYEQITDLFAGMAVDEELRRAYLVGNYANWAKTEGSLGYIDEADAILMRACEAAQSSTQTLHRAGLVASVNEAWALVHQFPFAQTGLAAGGLFCP